MVSWRSNKGWFIDLGTWIITPLMLSILVGFTRTMKKILRAVSCGFSNHRPALTQLSPLPQIAMQRQHSLVYLAALDNPSAVEGVVSQINMQAYAAFDMTVYLDYGLNHVRTRSTHDQWRCLFCHGYATVGLRPCRLTLKANIAHFRMSRRFRRRWEVLFLRLSFFVSDLELLNVKSTAPIVHLC